MVFEDVVGVVYVLLLLFIIISDVDLEWCNLKYVCLCVFCMIMCGLWCDDGVEALWRWWMDFEFYCEYDEDLVWRLIEIVLCYFVVVYGEYFLCIDVCDVEFIVKVVLMNVKSSRAYVVVGVSRFVVEDAMVDMWDMIMYVFMWVDDDMLVKNK